MLKVLMAATGIALVLGLLGGCAEERPIPLRVGVSPWIGYEPLVLAREQRLIDPERIGVVELSSSSETKRNFRNGMLDVAALSLDDVLRLADTGPPVRIVAVLSRSHGADAVLAKPELSTPADLRGKRIAVERSSLGSAMLGYLLEAGGLIERDVKLVTAEAGHHEHLMRSLEVDAVITFEPIATRLRSLGYVTVFDSRAIPESMLDVLAVREEVLARRRDEIVELIEGWARALAVLDRAPDLAARLLAPGTELSPAHYKVALQGVDFLSLEENAFLLSGEPAPFAELASATVAMMRQFDWVAGAPELSALLAPEAVGLALTRLEARP